MKILSAEQIRRWDQVTISNHYSDSSELMEVAARHCAEYIREEEAASSYMVFCGTGNNGGDGLCIARLLAQEDIDVTVLVLGDAEKGSKDFGVNLRRLLEMDTEIRFLNPESELPDPTPDVVVIDCIFGMGISKPVIGWLASVIQRINQYPCRVISIDLPSGLQPDVLGKQTGVVVEADLTLSFEQPKRAMLLEENYEFVGEFEIISIGLDPLFPLSEKCDWYYYTELDASFDLLPRGKFDHKNDFGHLLIHAGSRGKMGAAVLCTLASMRCGLGLATCHVPACGMDIMQISVPEAMCMADTNEYFLTEEIPSGSFAACAAGPGIGKDPMTAELIGKLLDNAHLPLVLDADALNLIAERGWQKRIPAGSILTPHIGEFDRLFGSHADSKSRLETAIRTTSEGSYCIVLKGAHTAIIDPSGTVCFNSSGNPGMATAGSGDVLTGCIAAFMAQGYAPQLAARLAVFVHGLAGDYAATEMGESGMIAGDIVEMIPQALRYLEEIGEIIR